MKLFPRKLLPRVIDYLDDREIIVIHGSRQVGKTSLLHLIMDHLRPTVPAENLIYFDLEDFHLLELCNRTPDEVIAYLKGKGADFSRRVYLLIDEIQYLRDPSSFLKLFHDHHGPTVKLIVSGSSSFEIRKKFKDSLVGRFIDFELFTLDFDEFLTFKGLRYQLDLDPGPELAAELRELYTRFVLFGGYPTIVREERLDKKEAKLNQIITTYIKKDIRDLAAIKEPDKFNALVTLLAGQVGGLVNGLELAATLGLSKPTVQNYLFLLENTYLIRRVRPFHGNLRSELTKMPKVYFEDTGMANLLANRTFAQQVNGALLENSVFAQVRRGRSGDTLHYWRTNRKQEVDFIVETTTPSGRQLTAVEVKTGSNTRTMSLRYFLDRYPGTRGFWCSLEPPHRPLDPRIAACFPWQLPGLLAGGEVVPGKPNGGRGRGHGPRTAPLPPAGAGV